MELTPVKTEEEKPAGTLGHVGSYLFLGAAIAASWFALPVLAAVVSAAPVLAGVAAVGGAAAVTAHKPWREKAVSFFKKAGSFFGEALGTIADDYRSARDWAKGRAAETEAALSAPANDDAAPGKLGAKASASDFNDAADAVVEAKAKKPAPVPTLSHGM